MQNKVAMQLSAREFTTQVQQKGIELAEILADWEAVNLRLEAAIEGRRAVGCCGFVVWNLVKTW